MILTKEALFAINDTKTETIRVDEWDQDVKIKRISGAERDEYEGWVFKKSNGKTLTDMKNIKAKLITMCLVDDNGSNLLDHNNKEHLDLLNAKSASALNFLFEACSKLNGMGQEEVEEAKKS